VSIIITFLLGYLAITHLLSQRVSSHQAGQSATQTTSAPDQITNTALVNNQSVTGSGMIIKILPDDTQGLEHQRFILRLASGQTVLIAHNIDIAPRIPDLARGDVVAFQGIYVSNDKGGVIHWTHHDPSGHHPDGWLKYHGQTYQ